MNENIDDITRIRAKEIFIAIHRRNSKILKDLLLPLHTELSRGLKDSIRNPEFLAAFQLGKVAGLLEVGSAANSFMLNDKTCKFLQRKSAKAILESILFHPGANAAFHLGKTKMNKKIFIQTLKRLIREEFADEVKRQGADPLGAGLLVLGRFGTLATELLGIAD